MDSIEVGSAGIMGTPTETHRNTLLQSPTTASDSGSPLPPDLESSMEAGMIPVLSPSPRKTRMPGTKTVGDGSSYTRI